MDFRQQLANRFRMPQAVGPGVLPAVAITEFDYYDRMFFFNAADLAGKSIDFFQQGIGDTYTPTNGANTDAVTKQLVDTNADLKGQTAYTLRIHGIAIELGTTQAKAGAAALDLASWPMAFQALLEDAAVEFLINDTVYDRFKPKHAPAGGGAFGMGALATTAAATSLSQAVMGNGMPAASNYKNYASAPLIIPQNNRTKVRITFGSSILANNFDYKPATGSPAKLFWTVRLIGTRANAVQ